MNPETILTYSSQVPVVEFTKINKPADKNQDK